MVVVGGIVPEQDFNAPREADVSAIFTPGTVIPEAADRPIGDLNRRLCYAQADRVNLLVSPTRRPISAPFRRHGI